jgi:hypothetical protein
MRDVTVALLLAQDAPIHLGFINLAKACRA